MFLPCWVDYTQETTERNEKVSRITFGFYEDHIVVSNETDGCLSLSECGKNRWYTRSHEITW